MSRGLKERIFFPVAKEDDEDRIGAYLEKLKTGKENKGVKILITKGKSPKSSKIEGYFIVLIDNPTEEVQALDKQYKQWQKGLPGKLWPKS